MSDRAIIEVELGERSYDVRVGSGLLAGVDKHLAPLIAEHGNGETVVITDSNVAELYLAPLSAALDRAGLGHREIVLDSGEQTKDFAHFQALLDDLLEGGLERGTMLIALGGGVVGDITGFAAAVALRGLDFVQIPTTLLAQVDSSVGGKTGINTRQGKNLVGAFHQPRMVLADIDTLDSLPRRELLAGYAEVVKYGLLGDAGFFQWLEAHGPALIEGDKTARIEAVAVSCRAKAAIVAADEREHGRRALLNLGHTFAHAMEAESGFSDQLLHGEAVALGMALAFDLSEALGDCPAGEAERIRAHYDAVGLPSRPEGYGFTAPALVAHMRQDKKVRAGHITFILATGIGQAHIARDVPDEKVALVLTAALGG